MKAYRLSVKDNEDAGNAIVFANTTQEARKQIYGSDLYDATDGEWIRVQAHRAKSFDDMEALSESELDLRKWKDGWRWFDMDYPDPDTASDEEFYQWHKDTFGETK